MITGATDSGIADHLRRIPPIPAATALPRVNAHIHIPPNFSAFSNPVQAVEMGKRERMRLIGLSNYYDFGVYTHFSRIAAGAGIHVLSGIEIMARDEAMAASGIRANDPANPGKVYICGKGAAHPDDPAPRAAAILDAIRRNDSNRMASMVVVLNNCLTEAGIGARIDVDALKGGIAKRAGVRAESVFLQERHVAEAAQQILDAEGENRVDGYARVLGTARDQIPKSAAETQDLVRSRLMKVGKPAFVAESYVSLEESRELILGLGAIPCYPVLADGVKPLTEFESTPEELVARLKSLRLYAAEFIPLRNDPEVLLRYVPTLRAAGFAVSAGTEHNSPAMPSLVPMARGGAIIPPQVEAILYEGACVALAHQHLVRNGTDGFVDRDGEPCRGFTNDDERIRCFAALGHQLILEGPSTAS